MKDTSEEKDEDDYGGVARAAAVSDPVLARGGSGRREGSSRRSLNLISALEECGFGLGGLCSSPQLLTYILPLPIPYSIPYI